MARQGENLREACCIGDFDAVRGMLAGGVDINSQNSMNGWTALHWAVHRGHCRVVSLLLSQGASTAITSSNGQTPGDLAKRDDVIALLGGECVPAQAVVPSEQPESTFEPSYLRNPQMVYVPPKTEPERSAGHSTGQTSQHVGLPLAHSAHSASNAAYTSSHTAAATPEAVPSATSANCLVVKARIAGSSEEDFVEVDVRVRTFNDLVLACADEFELDATQVTKVRRLPNVLVRKDRDVERLVSGCELEIVLTT